MTFEFNAAIPQSSDLRSDSQEDLLDNNISLNGIFSRNHVPLTITDNKQGRHTFVEMVNVPLIPNPPGGLQDLSGTIYTIMPSADVEENPVSNLKYSNDNSGNEYQLTTVAKYSERKKVKFFGASKSLKGSPVNGKGVGGWTFLPGGLLLQYGILTQDAGKSTTVPAIKGMVFPMPFSIIPYCMEISFSDTTTGTITADTVRTSSVTKFGFNIEISKISTSAVTYNIHWLAIGKY